jgi:ribonuclease-3
MRRPPRKGSERREPRARRPRPKAAPRADAIDLEPLQEKIGHRFRDLSLLDLALTHRSSANEAGRPGRDNEAMEFLGDAILGFVAAESLFGTRAKGDVVGSLSRRRAAMVSEPALARLSRALGVGEVLRLGRGETSSGGREKASILADAFEAIVAAIFLDGGLEAARAFVRAQIGEELAATRETDAIDPKTRLQEILQAEGMPPPEYRVVESSGPDHARAFVVEVVIGGRAVARSEGRSKKAAGTEAARRALEELEVLPRRKDS